ncbi:hypothetical protein ACIQOW_14385 [Kitasatospora sp. NPDC091335]|uniref:hypothetical protein n=1 Tax=Kitasatospora sp. NPDC091335 TaxID=3364085 RepID=UPI00382DD9A6
MPGVPYRRTPGTTAVPAQTGVTSPAAARRRRPQEALDVVGREERRLLGVLSERERRTLADLLRKVMPAQEGGA